MNEKIIPQSETTDKKLLNESFVRNAPASLVRAETEKKSQALDKLKKLEEKLEKYR